MRRLHWKQNQFGTWYATTFHQTPTKIGEHMKIIETVAILSPIFILTGFYLAQAIENLVNAIIRHRNPH